MKKIHEICLIEDEPIPIFLSKKFIEKTESVELVTEFMNGKQAYDAMQQRSQNGEPFPDFIFLDINMPVWDGWEFYEEFLKLPESESVQTYILTSSINDEDYQKANLYGLMDNYILKPLSFNKIKKMLGIE